MSSHRRVTRSNKKNIQKEELDKVLESNEIDTDPDDEVEEKIETKNDIKIDLNEIDDKINEVREIEPVKQHISFHEFMKTQQKSLPPSVKVKPSIQIENKQPDFEIPTPKIQPINERQRKQQEENLAKHLYYERLAQIPPGARWL